MVVAHASAARRRRSLEHPKPDELSPRRIRRQSHSQHCSGEPRRGISYRQLPGGTNIEQRVVVIVVCRYKGERDTDRNMSKDAAFIERVKPFDVAKAARNCRDTSRRDAFSYLRQLTGFSANLQVLRFRGNHYLIHHYLV